MLRSTLARLGSSLLCLFLTACLFLLSPLAVGVGWSQGRSWTAVNLGPGLTVAKLPSATNTSGQLWLVKDGSTAGDCTVGGGTSVNLCLSTGSAYTIFAGAAGQILYTAGSVPFASSTGVLTQDNATFFWDTAGKSLIVGSTLTGEGHAPEQLTVSGNGATATRSTVSVRSYSATAAAPALLVLARAQGTAALPTAVQANDTLGRVIFRGDDGTAFQTSGRISGVAAETFDGTHRGNYIQFDTAALASTSVLERLRIGPAGVVSFGVGATSSIPALKPSGTTLTVRLGDDSAAATLSALTLTSTQATGTAPLTVTSTTPVANLAATPTTYNAAGTQQTGVHVVQDTCTLGTSCAITLAGAAVFTNATSYTCVCEDDSAIGACRVSQGSGTSVTITGTGTDVIRYICVGA